MMNRGLRFHRHIDAESCGESGQALIELALSLPLLLLLLLGAAEFGRLAYMAIEVSDAAKAAAQYGAQNSTTASDSGGILLTAQKTAPYVNSYCTNFTASAPNPPNCTCMTNGTPNPSTPTSAACTAACAGYIVEVLQINTSATCNPLIHPNGFSAAGITLHGSAVQEVLN
ncbi:MAG TPA: TadE/TadG family type IV pilus assembly protein [Terracidiphilus sp.]|nr:TadE/TadG family type IV pilus assembly protein [Terracidiphilus sp.]